MNIKHLTFLVCPKCNGQLILDKKKFFHENIVKEGTLSCKKCESKYPIINYIPRFLKTSKKEVISFGYQWNSFPLSQIDEVHNIDESSTRLFSETTLDKDSILGSSIIEIGCGAGRFLNVIKNYNPSLVVGVDASNAVDSLSNHLDLEKENILIVQADIFNLPFKVNNFDHVFSIGVIHHTIDPFLAFKKIAMLAKNNGRISISVYENSLAHRSSKNTIKLAFYDFLWSANFLRCEIYRYFFSRLPSKIQIYYCKLIVPILHYLNKIPILRILRYFLPSTCYKKLPVSYSIVDTMDTYATKIVYQFRAKTIYFWFISIGCKPELLLSRDGWVSVSTIFEEKNNNKIISSKIKELPKSSF